MSTASCSGFICLDRVSLTIFRILLIQLLRSVTSSVFPVHSHNINTTCADLSRLLTHIVCILLYIPLPFVSVPWFLRVRAVSVASIPASVFDILTMCVLSYYTTQGVSKFSWVDCDQLLDADFALWCVTLEMSVSHEIVFFSCKKWPYPASSQLGLK